MNTSDYSTHSKRYKKYVDYESEEWTALKARRRELDGNRCVFCGRPGITCRNGLQTHHLTYDRLGHENIRDIISVCGSCHGALENRMVLKPGQYDPRTPETQERFRSYMDYTNRMPEKDLSHLFLWLSFPKILIWNFLSRPTQLLLMKTA